MSIPGSTATTGLGGLPGSSTTSSSTGGATGKMQMGRQEFLKLLLTQMKNQDPLNPMKGQEFASHLAQFSSVEQLININETLTGRGDSTQQLARSLQHNTAAGLIGKTVRADGSSLQLEAGQEEVEIPFSLGQSADQVSIRITDEGGNPVRTIEQTGVEAGDQTVTWNGRDDEGNRLPEGTYSISVDAADGDGEAVDAQTYLQGVVERVRFTDDAVELMVNGEAVALDQIASVAP